MKKTMDKLRKKTHSNKDITKGCHKCRNKEETNNKRKLRKEKNGQRMMKECEESIR